MIVSTLTYLNVRLNKWTKFDKIYTKYVLLVGENMGARNYLDSFWK